LIEKSLLSQGNCEKGELRLNIHTRLRKETPVLSLNVFYHFGRYLNLLKRACKRPEKFRMYWNETMRQMNDIGVGSVLIIVLISVFIGAVSAVQFAYQLNGQLVPRYYIGYIVRDLCIIELSPTVSCLVLAGKVGSNMAAEIGGMRQKEHIDAMEVMGVNTAAFLVMPKVIAAVFVIPLLVSLSAVVGILGGYLSSVPTELLAHADYVRGLNAFFIPYNVYMMFVKATVYAFLLTTISCYHGYYVQGGSIELGKASTNAVVYGDIAILLSDYIITIVLTQ
jgi:phospholipid/cholesterol/gamma-HCH transport system permease protein